MHSGAVIVNPQTVLSNEDKKKEIERIAGNVFSILYQATKINNGIPYTISLQGKKQLVLNYQSKISKKQGKRNKSSQRGTKTFHVAVLNGRDDVSWCIKDYMKKEEFSLSGCSESFMKCFLERMKKAGKEINEQGVIIIEVHDPKSLGWNPNILTDNEFIPGKNVQYGVFDLYRSFFIRDLSTLAFLVAEGMEWKQNNLLEVVGRDIHSRIAGQMLSSHQWIPTMAAYVSVICMHARQVLSDTDMAVLSGQWDIISDMSVILYGYGMAIETLMGNKKAETVFTKSSAEEIDAALFFYRANREKVDRYLQIEAINRKEDSALNEHDKACLAFIKKAGNYCHTLLAAYTQQVLTTKKRQSASKEIKPTKKQKMDHSTSTYTGLGFFEKVPRELVSYWMTFLPLEELGRSRRVCKLFYETGDQELKKRNGIPLRDVGNLKRIATNIFNCFFLAEPYFSKRDNKGNHVVYCRYSFISSKVKKSTRTISYLQSGTGIGELSKELQELMEQYFSQAHGLHNNMDAAAIFLKRILQCMKEHNMPIDQKSPIGELTLFSIYQKCLIHLSGVLELILSEGLDPNACSLFQVMRSQIDFPEKCPADWLDVLLKHSQYVLNFGLLDTSSSFALGGICPKALGYIEAIKKLNEHERTILFPHQTPEEINRLMSECENKFKGKVNQQVIAQVNKEASTILAHYRARVHVLESAAKEQAQLVMKR